VARVVDSPAAWNATYHVVNREAVRFVDLVALAGLPLVSFPQWTVAVARQAPRYARFAAMVQATQGDDQSGGDELAFRYERTYDDKRPRAALGRGYPRPAQVDADYLSLLFTYVNSCQIGEHPAA
jgi:hypothetical protein